MKLRELLRKANLTADSEVLAAIADIADLWQYSCDCYAITFFCDENVAKVSVVGAGMESHPGIAARMFEALFEADINIQMIATSEIKISVLIDAKDADKAVEAVHNAFIPVIS